jgi:2-keto-4-pentenoate hydratase
MVGTRRRCLTSADRGVLYARRCLEFHPIAVRAEDWGRTLSTFEIDRKRDGTVVDHSRATDVLGEPVSALRYLIDSRDQVNPPLAAGDIVTTGSWRVHVRSYPAKHGRPSSHGCSRSTGSVSASFELRW